MCKDCGCGSTHADSVVLSIAGMTCGHCTDSVTKALLALPGVVSAEVHLAEGTATVHYNGHACSVDTLQQAITDIGFSVEGIVEHTPHTHGGILHRIGKLLGR